MTIWKVEFEKARENKSDLTLLQNNIIKCVKEKNEPRLIVNVVNVLAKYSSDFKDIGEEFLNSILDDEEIAKILNVQFFKKAKGRNFAKRLKVYVGATFKDAEVILRDTLVWNNAEKVRKQRKNKMIIIISSVAAAIAIAVSSILIYLNSADKDSIDLEKGESIIDIVHDQDPDLTGYTIVFTKKDGTVERVAVTPDMLSGYDKDTMGIQQANITYMGKTFEVTVEIHPSKLKKTEVSVSGYTLTWNRVANAQGYYIYFLNTSGALGEAEYATVDDIDGNATLVYDLTTVDKGSTTFYATVVAFSNTKDKNGVKIYEDSDRATEIAVTKLSAPDNVKYSDGKLTWDPVAGAVCYSVTKNGKTINSDIALTELVFKLDEGDNNITVSAIPAEPGVIMSVTSKTVHKLKPIDAGSIAYIGNSITWTASSGSNYYNVYIDDGAGGNFTKVASAQSGRIFNLPSLDTGVYTIRIEVAANTLNEVNSDPFSITVTRLADPVITVNDGEFFVNGNPLSEAPKLSWYVDGALTETLSAMPAGEHRIYAVARANSEGELVSLTSGSNAITVIKLRSPELNYSSTPKRTITCTPETVEGGTLKYYKVFASGEREEWSIDNIDKLSGINRIVARFVSSGGNVLNSEESNIVTIMTTGVNLEIKNAASTKPISVLTNGEEGLYYQHDKIRRGSRLQKRKCKHSAKRIH